MYHIYPYSKKRARELGVKIKASENPKKKIDVYDYYNNYICSIGAYGMGDYEIFLAEYGKKCADEHRRLYRLRHKKDMNIIGSRGYYSSQLLWRG
jgi:hypothetical protein